jgi:DNA-binding transcriptional regulator YhcF (GntR family)
MNDRVGVVVVPLLLVAVWLVRAPRRWGRSRRLLERDPSRCGALAGRREAVRWRWAGLGLVPADDILGRRSAEAVVAATGVMVATLLFGVALNAGAPLIGLSCSLTSWPGVGVAPLVVKALMLPLAVGRLAPDGRPALVSAGAGRARSSRSGRPTLTVTLDDPTLTVTLDDPTLTVTLDKPTPRYEQLPRQLVDLIEGGVLVQGGRHRRLRQLAGDLGLAVGAVARTYRELEAAGLVGSRRGGGTRVAVAARKPSARERRALLASPTAAYVTKARALGATDAQITEALRAQPT